MKLRDVFWIWGHPAGAHNTGWGLTAPSTMGPAEGARYLGVRNMMMVCYGDEPVPPFDDDTRAFDAFNQVVWSVVGNGTCTNQSETLGNLDEILRLAKTHPNITGGLFDDFFQEGRDEAYPPEKLRVVQHRLRTEVSRPLDLWVVVYDHQLEKPLGQHLQYVDGITFWTWLGRDLGRFEENFARLKQVAPDKKILLGCYLYNYGECKEMTAAQMTYQLEQYARKLRAKEAEGVILLSNNVVDLDYESVEYAREWLCRYGDEDL